MGFLLFICGFYLVSGIMCSYNAVNGIPSCANDWLLKEVISMRKSHSFFLKKVFFKVLRGDWDFDGYVTSDCDADYDVFYRHNYTKTPEETVRDVLRAGTDVDCGGFVSKFAASALSKGLISESDLDARLRNLFRIRYRLGHFDVNSPLSSVNLSVVCSDESLALARDGVTQSAVLLKNSDFTLPFRSSSWTFAVIGPNANLSQSVAGYYGPPNVCDNKFWTVYDAVAAQTDTLPLYSPGTSSVLSNNLSMIDAAVSTAQQADQVVLVLGTDLSWAAEGQDAKSIVLNKGQQVLVDRVTAAATRPVVIVLLTATPLDLTDILNNPKGWCVLKI